MDLSVHFTSSRAYRQVPWSHYFFAHANTMFSVLRAQRAMGRARLPQWWGRSARSFGWLWCCSHDSVQSEQNIQKSNTEAQNDVRQERLFLMFLEGPCHHLSFKRFTHSLKPHLSFTDLIITVLCWTPYLPARDNSRSDGLPMA